MDPVRVGILGCASIAWRSMGPALSADPSIRLVAVASRTAENARRFAERFGVEAVVGYQRLLERPDIEAVYVPLPTGLHHEWVGRALEAGKHVLAEKSLTTDATATRELVTLARERGLLVMENFMFLHHPQHEYIRRLVADGAVGPLRVFRAEFAFPPRPPGDIRYSRELGGGALLDAGAYPVRAAQFFLDSPLTVDGAFLAYDRPDGVDVRGGALLHDASGVVVQTAFGFEHAYRCSYTLWGAEGVIELDRVFTTPADMRPVVRIHRQDHREERVLPPADHFAGVVAHFARLVRTGDMKAEWSAACTQADLLTAIRSAAGKGD